MLFAFFIIWVFLYSKIIWRPAIYRVLLIEFCISLILGRLNVSLATRVCLVNSMITSMFIHLFMINRCLLRLLSTWIKGFVIFFGFIWLILKRWWLWLGLIVVYLFGVVVWALRILVCLIKPQLVSWLGNLFWKLHLFFYFLCALYLPMLQKSFVKDIASSVWPGLRMMHQDLLAESWLISQYLLLKS